MTNQDDGSTPRRKPERKRQLALDLAREPSFDPEEFLVSPTNAAAHTAIEQWPAWPTRSLILVGPAGSGKSHLAAIWAKHSGARTLTVETVGEFFDPNDGSVVALLEDCDRTTYDQPSLFHLINTVIETNGSMLMTARSDAAQWNINIPDLISRLRLVEVARIGRPDVELVKAIIIKLFNDRQIRVDEGVVSYAALHCDQSLDAISAFVAAVDEDALAFGRRVTRPLAAKTMARLQAEQVELFNTRD